jgi:energy-coupling factor transport system ATP-binding protein
MTVIIIEHRLEDVLYRDVDRIVLMDGGRIVADMTPDEMLASDILMKYGIREPLYISALKAAGAVIDPSTHPQHIETMDISPYRETVRNWYRSMPRHKKATDSEVILSVKDLEFSYDEKRKIIDKVSFDIKKGEMVALVGKNGAGKSTLASLICGFITPDAGRIELFGEDISPLSIKERGEKIGFCMQSPNQMISKPMIYDEVALGLRARNAPDVIIKEKVEDALKICGLYPFRNWPVSALSFGQKKRVSIASILVMSPEMLILDEPTAGQDYKHYTEIMEFIMSIRRTLNITIVMITHDMHLMLEYTDRTLVLADGRLLMDAAPSEILTRDDICDRAYLKRTSLYDLAVKCGINDADVFVSRFIEDERSRRKGASL